MRACVNGTFAYETVAPHESGRGARAGADESDEELGDEQAKRNVGLVVVHKVGKPAL